MRSRSLDGREALGHPRRRRAGRAASVAGPILLVLTLTDGAAFGAIASRFCLAGVIGLTAFSLVYARVAQLAGPPATVLAGWAAFLLCIGVLYLVDPAPAASLTIVAGGAMAGWFVVRPAPQPSLKAGEHPWWDLPGRALMALALVVTVTGASASLGPRLSGLLAPFPIITCVLAAFTHAHYGPDRVALLVRSFLPGFCVFALSCFALSTLLAAT